MAAPVGRSSAQRLSQGSNVRRFHARGMLAALASGMLVLFMVLSVLAYRIADDDGSERALGDGFSVAEGTRLIGVVFPDRAPSSWRAHLNVVGNPISVMNRYMTQARRAGFVMEVGCFLSYIDEAAPVGLQRSMIPVSSSVPKPQGLTALRCEARGKAPDEVGREKEVHFELTRSTGTSTSRLGDYSEYRNDLLILHGREGFTRSNISRFPQGTAKDYHASLPAAWAQGVPAAQPAPELPGAGQEVVIAPYSIGERIRIEDGSVLLSPAMAQVCPYRSESQAVIAVMEVVGDRSKILDAYLRQIPTVAVRSTVKKSERQFRGETAIMAEADRAENSDDFVRLAVLSGPSNRSYIEIIQCFS